MPATSYLIIGSGVFGASTALHLARKHPDSKIVLVDRNAFDAPTRVAASWDWNKVVRADYEDIIYTKLALEARHLWESDTVWKPYFHQTGVLWISSTEFAGRVRDNFKRLGAKDDLRIVPVDECKKLYGGIFDDADYTGITDVLLNKSSGWANAKEALQNTIQEAVKLGVEYIAAEVTSLRFADGEDGDCTGVVTASGDVITADKVVLSTGAFTPRLLSDSAPRRRELHASERIMASAVAEATVPLSEEQIPIFRGMPVAIQVVPLGQGG